MRSYLFRLAGLALSAALLGCQGPGTGTSTTPESHPDLSGVWIGPATTLEPPAQMTAQGQAFFDAA